MGRAERRTASNFRFVPFAAVSYSQNWTERKNRITSDRVEPITAAERAEEIRLASRSQAAASSKGNELAVKKPTNFPSEIERAKPSPEYFEIVGKSKIHDSQAESSRTPGQIRQPVYTSLVSKALKAHQQVPGVEIPQWIVELWQETTDFFRAVKRLGLPETSVKTKLPYYREAMIDWQESVVPADNLSRAVEQYHRSGDHGHFTAPPDAFDRSRGKRFDMPQLDIKAIVFANLFTMWALARTQI